MMMGLARLIMLSQTLGTILTALADCSDDGSFQDEKGYACSDWAGYDCTQAADVDGYSQQGENALLESCKQTCGQCSEASTATTTVTTEVPAASTTIAAQADCSDDGSFQDEKGYACSDWAGYDCTQAADVDGYSQQGENDLLESCKQTCGQCSEASTATTTVTTEVSTASTTSEAASTATTIVTTEVPTASTTIATQADCSDDGSFQDEKGYACSDWTGYDCTQAADVDGYSQQGENDLLESCKQTCGQCSEASTATTTVITEVPAASTAIAAASTATTIVTTEVSAASTTIAAQADCSDDGSFQDEKGYACSDWAGYDCTQAADVDGYSQQGENALLESCKQTCGQCSEASTATTTVTTEVPAASIAAASTATTLVTTEVPAASTTIAAQADCSDDGSFRDEYGYPCSDWTGYDCTQAADVDGYSQEGENALLESCRQTCGQCSQGIVTTGVPEAATSAAAQEVAVTEDCSDDASFKDEYEYSCADWKGYDCTTAHEEHQYSQQGLRNLLDNCQLTCAQCIQAHKTLKGSIEFTSTALTESQVTESVEQVLMQTFSVNKSQVSVSVVETRRLRDEKNHPRRLGGTWTVSFKIVVPSSQFMAAEDKAVAIFSNPTAFNQAMKSKLQDLGVSGTDAAIQVSFRADCSDNDFFLDQQEYPCSSWSGYDCKSEVNTAGYTEQGVKDLLQNCKKTCNQCQPPPKAATTTYVSGYGCEKYYASKWLDFAHKPGGVCLDDAMAAGDRQWQGLRFGRNLTIGTTSGGWTSQEMSARIIGILIREKLGVHLDPCFQEYMEVSNMWAATAGCVDADDWNCREFNPSNALYDFVPEFWNTQANIKANMEILSYNEASDNPKVKNSVVDVGSLGYVTSDTLGVWADAVNRALNASGGTLSLDWFQNLQSPAAMQYFTPLRKMDITYGVYQYCGAIDDEHLRVWGYRCNYKYNGNNPWRKPINGSWHPDGEMLTHIRPLYDCQLFEQEFPKVVKDYKDAGFVCKGQGWWLSPRCAARSPSDEYLDDCIPTLTFDPSRAVATLIPGLKEIPAVVACISWWDEMTAFQEDYAWKYKRRQNGQQNVALMMMFTPDASMRLRSGFDNVDILKVQFTPRISEPLNTAVTIAHEDLLQTSPAVAGLLKKLQVPSDQILKILDETVDTFKKRDANGTRIYSDQEAKNEAACEWLRKNTHLWEDFIGAASCWGGTYWSESARRCIPCPAGTTSERGASGVDECTPCPAGTSTADAGGLCVPCLKGKYSGVGETECVNCARGSYGNVTSLAQCYECPEGKSTEDVGEVSSASCDCRAGYYSTAATTSTTCMECPAKMDCHGFGAFPLAQPGYMTWDDGLKVYKCYVAENCPGGVEGTCAKGLEGVGCGKCPNGEHMVGAMCQKCTAAEAWPIVLLYLATLCGICCIYYSLASTRTAKATQIMCTACAASIMVSALQVYGLFDTLEFQWPRFFKDFLSIVAILSLDFKIFNISCAFHSSFLQYLSRVMFFFMILVSIPLLAISSRCLPAKWRWTSNRTFSLAGSFCSMCFISMAVLSFTPQSCYSHPNNNGRSIAVYPDVLCWESDEYNPMFLLSILSTLFCVCYYGLCIYLAILAPSRSCDRVKGPYFLGATRFLFQRFRVDAWYWGLCLLLRSLSLSLVPVMFADSTHAQLIAMACIFAVFLAVHVRLWPWKIPVLNVVEVVIMVCMLLTVITASRLENFSVGVLVVLALIAYGSVAVVMSVGVASFCFRSDAGALNDVFTWPHYPPKASDLSAKLIDVSTAVAERGPKELTAIMGQLPIYDVLSMAQSAHVMSQCGYTKNHIKMTRGPSRRISMNVVLPSSEKVTPVPTSEPEENNFQAVCSMDFMCSMDSTKKIEDEEDWAIDVAEEKVTV